MSLQDGDVVRFDYTLWIQGEKTPLETSMEDVAKAQGIHRADKAYRPLTVAIGQRQILPALERHLRDHAEPGKALSVDLPAAEAYGERDPAKIKDVPMAQFRKQKIDPKPGMELNFQGQRGVVTRVAGGRIRVDLNHDLAGKALRYEYTLRAVISDEQEKVQAILDGLFVQGTPKVEFRDGQVVVEVPDQAKFDREWPMHKFRIIAELRAATGEARDIVLQETYPARPQASSEEE